MGGPTPLDACGLLLGGPPKLDACGLLLAWSFLISL